MEFKKIQFKDTDAQKIYDNYLKQIRSVTQKLSLEDQDDILMELNSHIFESVSRKSGSASEVSTLINTLDKIGVPNDILKPLIAEKKLNQATKSFNPIHVFQALMLNFSKGTVYFFFFVLYLFLFSFFILIPGKIFYPDNVGFYYEKGEIFQYGGFLNNENLQQHEILGNWFIPVTILLILVFYFLITALLNLNRIMSKKNVSTIQLAM